MNMSVRVLLMMPMVLLLVGTVGEARGQQLVYEPRNPAFGGNPINYQWMLSSADAQNDYKEEDGGRQGLDPFQDFEKNLQQQILNQLTREIVNSRFSDLDLTQAGQYDLGDFRVEVVPSSDGVNINVFNTSTGDEATILIPRY